MPEQVDLAAIRQRFERFRRYEDRAGGPLTGEEHVSAIAAAWDVEPLLDELERVRSERARWSFAAGYYRGEISGLIADMPAGAQRDAAQLRIAEVDERLFPDRAAAGGGAGNPAVEDQPPPTQPETEG